MWDFYGDPSNYGSTWIEPDYAANKIVDFDGDGDGIVDGVMGTAGVAYWGAYGYTEDTPEARAALAAELVKPFPWGNAAGWQRFAFRALLPGRLRAILPNPVAVPLCVGGQWIGFFESGRVPGNAAD